MFSISRQRQSAMLAVLLLAGCAGQPLHEGTVGIREDGLVTLTRADQNRVVQLRVGERLEVRLPENPTTGFGWAVDENDRQLLLLENTAYVPPEDVGFIGTRGQRTFRFIARQPGEVALKLKYWRIWEGDRSVTERFAVTLQITQ